MAVTSTKAWQIYGHQGVNGLTFNTEFEVPSLSANDVLVRFYAASLNFRDILIFTGQYPLGNVEGVVPGSDGAGIVLAVGSAVTRFVVGDRVVTHMLQTHFASPLNLKTKMMGLGSHPDGTLREHGVFNENGLVSLPHNLSWQEGSTLSCAALTAWNALYPEMGRCLRAGDWVLVQGTGGVAIFAVQFAKLAGAKIIATTSSSEKAAHLKNLGADHTILYSETPNWGEVAKGLTPGKEGVDLVIEIGGPTTFGQSLKAVRLDGMVALIGFVGGFGKEPSFVELFFTGAIVRPISVGSRNQLEEMCKAIEAGGIQPVIDGKVFTLKEAKEAYEYMLEQKHVGKIVVTID